MPLRSFVAISLASLGLASFANAQDVKYHSLGDGSIYAKTFSTLLGTTTEEVGVAAPFATWRQWSIKWNAGYLLNFPLQTTGVRPLFVAGGALTYRLMNGGLRPELYTKTKWYNSGNKVQESGLYLSKRWGHYGLVGNLAYIMGYQKDWVVKPKWQAGITLNLYFK